MAGPGGMPDLRRMSGIPLVDGRTPAGTIVVRCIHGTIDKPAIGAEVTLEVRTKDGSEQVFKAEAAEKGRATFDQLGPLAGATAVARVTYASGDVVSQPISIRADAGTAVMLVEGASGSASGASAAPGAVGGPPGAGAHGGGQHGGAEVPLPGKPFPLPERPRGTVVVGMLDLGKGAPLEGIEVELHVARPSAANAEEAVANGTEPPGEGRDESETGTADPEDTGEPGEGVEVLRGRTNQDGRAVFDGLVPPEYPEGTKVTVHGVLEEGGARQSSETFELPEQGVAVVLTMGRSAEAGGARTAMRIPPPHRDQSVPASHVRVEIVDPSGAPLDGVTVEVVRQQMAGGGESATGVTDEQGLVDVPVVLGPGSFYFVGATYEGAPYRTGFFEVPEDQGVRATVRVWPVTGDRSHLRSVVQFDFQRRENDKVLVSQIFAVMHEGEKAFWPQGGMRIDAPDGAKSLQVLPGSGQWIEAPEDASYVTLSRPLPPGEEVRLSFAYLLEHDGDVELSWQAPFPLMKGLVSIEEGLEFTKGKQGPPKPAPHGNEGIELYEFDPGPHVESTCGVLAKAGHRCPSALASGGTDIELGISGLPRREKALQWVAIGVGGFIVLGTGLLLVMTPRADPRRQLLTRKGVLLEHLRGGALQGPARDELLAELDSIYRRLDVLDAGEPQRQAEGR
jgi:5-hydroxyisourate hydrolase-like protein (transthyretin family)